MERRLAEIHEAADEEVKACVVVVVKPYSARSPAHSRDSGFFCHVRECPVAVVVIQNASAVLRDVDIGKSVAIIVCRSDAHSVSTSGDTGFFCDVRERSVAIVVVERVSKRSFRLKKIATAAVHQVDVHPSVIVVVEERTAGARRFRKEVFRRPSIYVSPKNLAFRRWYSGKE